MKRLSVLLIDLLFLHFISFASAQNQMLTGGVGPGKMLLNPSNPTTNVFINQMKAATNWQYLSTYAFPNDLNEDGYPQNTPAVTLKCTVVIADNGYAGKMDLLGVVVSGRLVRRGSKSLVVKVAGLQLSAIPVLRRRAHHRDDVDRIELYCHFFHRLPRLRQELLF